MAGIDLETEYNNRARVPDHPTHIAAWHRDAAAYRATARCEIDISYGAGARHRLDLFHPDQDAGGPVVFFIHGGYWQSLDKSYASHLARGANLRGLAVVVPSYDLAPAASLAEILVGIEAAADFAAERTQRSLVVAGHSAGGHLAACLMARPDNKGRPIGACMPISGIFDLEPLLSTSINAALGLTPEEARRLSPLHWRPPSGGRLAAVVGGAESSEFHRQSHAIVARWGAAGVAGQVTIVPGAHHFDVLAGLVDPNDRLVDLLVDLAETSRKGWTAPV
jgi:acetyl esterase/lipase